MLYIVMLPVKRNNVRNIAIINAPSITEVIETLNLPQGWMSWVMVTDIELEAVMQGKDHYHTMFLKKD